MGWNGSGSVVLTDGTRTGTPFTQQQSGAVNPTGALFDAVAQDLADSIETCLNRNSENKMAANLDLGTHKIVAGAVGTALTDMPIISQIQNCSFAYAGTVGGTGDVITLTVAPTPAAYALGQIFCFTAAAANTGAVTVNVNSLGAANIQSMYGAALTAGQIMSSGTYMIIYGGGPEFHLINPTDTCEHGWSPVITDDGAGSFGSTTVNTAQYCRMGNRVDFDLDVQGTIAGVVSAIYISGPCANADRGYSFSCRYEDAVYSTNLAESFLSAANLIVVKPLREYTFGEGALRLFVSGRYQAS